eukprot:SAG31_NODE_1808_length_7230_cov_32.785835_1_plen_80_part_00
MRARARVGGCCTDTTPTGKRSTCLGVRAHLELTRRRALSVEVASKLSKFEKLFDSVKSKAKKAKAKKAKADADDSGDAT